MIVSNYEVRGEMQSQSTAAEHEKLLQAAQEMEKHIAAMPTKANGFRSIAARFWAQRVGARGAPAK
jgi:hypothetical protein